ncbi:hypothetical protein Peur_037916 [Populus x canadensis]
MSLCSCVSSQEKEVKATGPTLARLSLFNYIPHNSINAKLSYTDQLRFLDKTAIMTPQDHVNADGSLVEEAICLLRVVPLWAAAIIYYFAIVQQHTYVVFRAGQSHRRIGNSNFKIPAATYIYCALDAKFKHFHTYL